MLTNTPATLPWGDVGDMSGEQLGSPAAECRATVDGLAAASSALREGALPCHELFPRSAADVTRVVASAPAKLQIQQEESKVRQLKLEVARNKQSLEAVHKRCKQLKADHDTLNTQVTHWKQTLEVRLSRLSSWPVEV